jgi:hypothetical protein
MAEYRIYQIKDKHIAAAPAIIEAAADQFAIEQAKQLLNGCDIEVWEGSRFVIGLRPRDNVPSDKPSHPNCPTCGVPMWLVKVELGEIADLHQFECKVCDRKAARTIPREQRV